MTSLIEPLERSFLPFLGEWQGAVWHCLVSTDRRMFIALEISNPSAVCAPYLKDYQQQAVEALLNVALEAEQEPVLLGSFREFCGPAIWNVTCERCDGTGTIEHDWMPHFTGPCDKCASVGYYEVPPDLDVLRSRYGMIDGRKFHLNDIAQCFACVEPAAGWLSVQPHNDKFIFLAGGEVEGALWRIVVSSTGSEDIEGLPQFQTQDDSLS